MIRTSKSKFLFRLAVIPVILLGLFTLSCAQDSIFFYISNEPEPNQPLIRGTPTNMVLANNEVFVGNRMGNTVFRYSRVGEVTRWSSLQIPGGSLGDIATCGTYLYTLIFPGGDPMRSSVIRRFDPVTNIWHEPMIMELYSIQTIFGVDGRIFAGAMHTADHRNFSILLLDYDANNLSALKSNTFLLTGATVDSEGNIYLATAGDGILRYSDGVIEANSETGTEDGNIAGIIGVGDSVVAVSSEGTVFYRTLPGIFETFEARVHFTGAMSLWLDRANGWRPSLLLMGIRGRGTSLNQGYREMVLDVSGNPTLTIRFPGDDSPSSVASRARYVASIGQHPVEAILQIPDISRGGPLDYSAFVSDPDWAPPIFAATSRSGLWSYRNGVWNAEE